MQSMHNNFKISRWSGRTFEWKSMRNGCWTGYYRVKRECDKMQYFLDCSWTNMVSRHNWNLVLPNVALSLRRRMYIEDQRYNQLRIYRTINWGSTVQSFEDLRYNHWRSTVQSFQDLRYNHFKIYGTMIWRSTVQLIEDLRDHQLRIYGTIISRSTVQPFEDLRYNHLKIYGTINWGSTGPSIEDLRYNHLKIYGTIIWRSTVLLIKSVSYTLLPCVLCDPLICYLWLKNLNGVKSRVKYTWLTEWSSRNFQIFLL